MHNHFKILLALFSIAPALQADVSTQVMHEEESALAPVVVNDQDATMQLEVDCAALQHQANQHLRGAKIAASVCGVTSAVALYSTIRLFAWGCAKQGSFKTWKDCEANLVAAACGNCEGIESNQLRNQKLGIKALFVANALLLPVIAGIPAIAAGVAAARYYKRYKQAQQVLQTKKVALAQALAAEQPVTTAE
jgi:hypothetical protein